MQYSILIYEPQSDFKRRNSADAPKYWAGWTAYSQMLQQAGIMRGGAGLEPPSTATSIRLEGSHRKVHDGPYADTKEQLGGFYLIEVANIDEALAWAEKCPAYSTGVVEIRPVMSKQN
jgi:hypothetical protein